MGWATDRLEVDIKKKKCYEEEDEEDDDDYDGSEASGYTCRHPPDGGWGWMVLLAAFVCNIIIDGIGFSFGTAQKDYMDTFNVTFSEVSWVGSSVTGSYLIVGPIVGALCFRFGLRKVTIIGSLIAMTGFVASSFLDNSLEMLIFTYGIVGGVGLGMMYLPSIVCVSYWFEKKLGIATGIAVCGSGLGQFVFPPLGEHLVSEYQWEGKHLILGAIVLHGAVCGAMFRLPDRWYNTRNKRCKQKVEIERGIIMRALIEDKKRQRTTSDGSLDNCVITTANRLIKLEPSLFTREKNQTLRKMLRQLGFSIQSLAVSKSSLHPSDQRVLMEALHQNKLDKENKSAANSKTNSPFLLPVAQLPKRNSSPDFNKSVSDQQSLNCSVSRSNSIMSNGIMGAGVAANGSIASGISSNGTNTPVKSFPKTRSCDALPQQPYNVLIKKIMTDRVRSNSECVTTHSSNNLPPAQMIHRGSTPTLGSLDISIHEIPGGETSSGYTSTSSINTDISTQFTNEYVPNASQNGFVTTCMISGQQLEANMREFEKQEARDNSLLRKLLSVVAEMFDVKLLSRPTFALFLLSTLFTLLAFYIPFFYIPTLGINIGMKKMDADYLPSLLGMTSTIGRLIVGWLGDRPWINTLHLNNGALLCAGVLTFILPFFKSPELLCVITAILGFCLAVVVALRSVLLVKFLGVELIPKSFGLLCLVQGIAAFAGSPLAGKLADKTHSLDLSFYVAGIFTVISGFILFPLGYLKRREDRLEAIRQAEEDQEEEGRMTPGIPAIASPVHSEA